MADTRGIRAGRAFVELGVSDRLSSGLKAAQKKLEAFGEGLRSIGTKMAGTVTIGDESRSLWIGGRLRGEDLRRFFQDDITYIPQWKCMEPFALRYEFPGCTVEVPRLGINMLKMARELGFAKAEAEMLKQIADQDTSLGRGGESHTP
ncbi:MAG TPA: hypothetical protein VK176_07660 [Phycisphaerales bacterium]|nr:hypothetical protein [Phycisphaerales bacterium]